MSVPLIKVFLHHESFLVATDLAAEVLWGPMKELMLSGLRGDSLISPPPFPFPESSLPFPKELDRQSELSPPGEPLQQPYGKIISARLFRAALFPLFFPPTKGALGLFFFFLLWAQERVRARHAFAD